MVTITNLPVIAGHVKPRKTTKKNAAASSSPSTASATPTQSSARSESQVNEQMLPVEVLSASLTQLEQQEAHIMYDLPQGRSRQALLAYHSVMTQA